MVKKIIFIATFLMCYLFGHSQEIRKCDCDTKEMIFYDVVYPESFWAKQKAFAEEVKNVIQDTIQGVVVIEFWVNKDGSTSEHKIIHSIRPDIDAKVLKMGKSITFNKFVNNGGNPSEGCFFYIIRFFLLDKIIRR